MTRVYGMSGSGNCHKVRMVLEALALPYEWTETNPGKGETRMPSFLALNPTAQVPTVQLDDGAVLAESNAIMFYFAEGSALVPAERLDRARMLQWMFFEQYSHEPYIAVARALRKFHPDPESQRAVIESKMAGGYRALEIMDGRLAKSPFFAGPGFSIADIALYAYTHVADEGGFELERFPAVQAWLARVKAQPRYVGMS